MQLMPDERTITRTRQHWSVMVPPLAAAALLLVVVVVLLVLLPGKIGSVQFGSIKLLVGLIVGLVLLLWLLLRAARWRTVTYLLTDRRIVLEAGILSKSAESISLDRVQNTVIRRPLGDRLIGAGNILIESAGRDGAEVLHRIPRAEAFYTQLTDAMEAMRTGGGLPPHMRGGV